jgi:hypothetical protein
MSAQDIQRIMMLAICSEEDARNAYEKTNDVIDAVDLLFEVPLTKGAPKKNTQSAEQKEFMEIRKRMEAMENTIQAGLKHSNQPESSSQVLSHIPAHVQEELMLRSDCIQSSHLATLEEVEQTQETACQ